MTGDDVREVFAAILPQEEIDRRCLDCDVMARQRQMNLGLLVRAMVIAAGTPGGAYQADLLRSSLACEVPQVARSAFSRWFDDPRARVMAALAARALAYARAQQVDRSGPLGGVNDGDIVDSTTVRVHAARHGEVPGTGAYAAITGHTVRSVGCGAPVRYPVSPAREHESRHLTSDASWRGCGLLADLASVSLARLRACHDPGGRGVIRLQAHWKPKVDSRARGQVTPAVFPGIDLEVLLEEEILVRDGRAIDADVRVGGANHPLPLRLVGVKTPQGSGVFRPNLPPRLGARQVADLYRIRWEVELSSTVDKSVHRLDQIDAARPCSVKPRLHASLMAAMMAALLAHRHKLQTQPPHMGAPRTAAPRPPRRLALQLAVSCQSIAQAFDLRGVAAKRRWQQLADVLTRSGREPHWRRRPSLLDPLRGWNRQPVTQKPASRRHLKAAA